MRRAAGLPGRRGDQWGATSATFAGQERAACAFERTARRRRVSMPPGEPKAMNGGLCERVRRGALKNYFDLLILSEAGAGTQIKSLVMRWMCLLPRKKSR